MRESVPAGGHSQCKGPEAGCLMSTLGKQQRSVCLEQREQGETRPERLTEAMQGLRGHRKELGFLPRVS